MKRKALLSFQETRSNMILGLQSLSPSFDYNHAIFRRTAKIIFLHLLHNVIIHIYTQMFVFMPKNVH